MSLNASALRLLRDKGLSADDIVALAEAMESRTKGAERQARYRARKRNVTRDVTPPLNEDNLIPPGPPSEANASATPRGKTDRGSRLPDDFEVPPEWIEWAMAKRRWSRGNAIEEAEGFCRYWQAKTGAAARKRDWLKTWQNWVVNSRRKDGDYVPPKPDLPPEQRIAELETRANWFAGIGKDWEAEDLRKQAEALRRRQATGPPGQHISGPVHSVLKRVG